MPELPEIETLKLSLEPIITSTNIEDVDIKCAKLRYQISPELKLHTANSRIIRLRRLAKYLVLDLDNEYSLIIHLGMSGRLTVRDQDYIFQKHDHIIFYLSNKQYLVFNDARRFGMVDFTETSQLMSHRYFRNLGLEPLSDRFDAPYLYNKLHNKNIVIKKALMDNNIVVGVGNIYASESLFISNIHPNRSCKDLTLLEISKLVAAIKSVLTDAISQGGTTLRDFVDGDNKPGYYKQKLMVYDRMEQQCFDCNDIIIKIKQAGRSTYYCSTCQKL